MKALYLSFALLVSALLSSIPNPGKMHDALALQGDSQKIKVNGFVASSDCQKEQDALVEEDVMLVVSRLAGAANSSLRDINQLCGLYVLGMFTRAEQQQLFGFTPFNSSAALLSNWVAVPLLLQIQATLVRFLMNRGNSLAYAIVLSYLLVTDHLLCDLPGTAAMMFSLFLYWVVGKLVKRGHSLACLLIIKLFVMAWYRRLHDSI